MQITINLTEEQRQELLKQLQNQKVEEPKDHIKKYLTLEGLKKLCIEEYHQYTIQNTDCQKIADEIKAGIYTTKNKDLDSKILLYAPQNKIGPYLCNIDARILLSNELLSKNGKEPANFINSYKKVLENKGTLPGTLADGSPETYKAIFTGIENFIVDIQTEKNPAKYEEFIISRPNQLIRAWTQNGNATHATLLYYTDSKTYALDTADKNRNGKVIDTKNLKELWGKNILHLEAIKKV